jgi:hypothetical protein
MTDLAAAFALMLLIGVSFESAAQAEDAISLDPVSDPFPCDALQLTPTGFTALKDIGVYCRGTRIYSTTAKGGINGGAPACYENGQSGIVLGGAMKDNPKNLLTIARAKCK